MRVLGIDVGLKRTGLALSDETGSAIRILPNLLAHSRLLALEKIMNIVRDFNVKAVVIGCPSPNTVGSKAIYVRAQGLKMALDQELKTQGFTTETHIWDETMTSQQALEKLIASGVPKKKRKHLLDGASASILVEEFLSDKKACLLQHIPT